MPHPSGSGRSGFLCMEGMTFDHYLEATRPPVARSHRHRPGLPVEYPVRPCLPLLARTFYSQFRALRRAGGSWRARGWRIVPYMERSLRGGVLAPCAPPHLALRSCRHAGARLDRRNAHLAGPLICSQYVKNRPAALHRLRLRRVGVVVSGDLACTPFRCSGTWSAYIVRWESILCLIAAIHIL
jgi:hypothetical protein